MPVSFDLTEDQLELQKWVHEFSANVVRPAAAEYDEREDFPWPVLQEAAKIGLYSLDFFATQWFDESGLGIPLTMEELFWGDAGIGLAIVGTTLAAASVRANGTDEQVGQWIPAMFGTVEEPKVAAFCSSEPDAGSDVGAMRTRAVYDEKTDEGVLTGAKTWATNGGRPSSAPVRPSGRRRSGWSGRPTTTRWNTPSSGSSSVGRSSRTRPSRSCSPT
jgi:alkylation response protein AidB-like acyl-CoA dehydrogenase